MEESPPQQQHQFRKDNDVSLVAVLFLCSGLQVLLTTCIYWLAVFPSLNERFLTFFETRVARPVLDALRGIPIAGSLVNWRALARSLLSSADGTSSVVRAQRVFLIALGAVTAALLLVLGFCVALARGSTLGSVAFAALWLLPTFLVIGVLQVIGTQIVSVYARPVCAKKIIGVLKDMLANDCAAASSQDGGGSCPVSSTRQ
jgi:hypothetical protein